MKKILLAFILMFSFSSFYAKDSDKIKALKGHVVDDQGEPIVGAKVIIEGVDSPVYTDFEGEFVLNSVPKTSIQLTISMVSFEENVSTIDLQNASTQEDLSIALESK